MNLIGIFLSKGPTTNSPLSRKVHVFSSCRDSTRKEIFFCDRDGAAAVVCVTSADEEVDDQDEKMAT
ncbi:hypothetical protein E2C01_036030 [Portunus trituberculatus]|uniref:Uncharacterized protein n=1 Tax=Portunus trituberculatus TaxID=210409 RepID=A0A5B7FAX7_PORTR|nr:hypothetical protein [Portunus trituberculatus]